MAREIKPIRRLGPTGPTEIANEIEKLTEQEVIDLSIDLGQSKQEAETTWCFYEQGRLIEEDVKDLHDRKKLNVERKLAKKKEASFLAHECEYTDPAVYANPRDASRVKQKTTVRDPSTGIVQCLRDV